MAEALAADTNSTGGCAVGLAVFGITGRMGQSLLRALDEAAAAPSAHLSPRLRLSGAIASPRSTRLGQAAAGDGAGAGIVVTADDHAGLRNAAVAIDFSVAECVAAHAYVCAQAGVPLVVGTTGLDATTKAALEAAAVHVAVLLAANTSVGVSLVTRLVRIAAAALRAADIEISEAHHRLKRDAPSGTALALGEAVASARGQMLSDVAVFDRHGRSAPRKDGEIGFAVLRAGDIVGEHTATFALAGEQVQITHRATDRITFARGALRAAAWLIGRPPGLYGMDEVLGLDQA